MALLSLYNKVLLKVKVWTGVTKAWVWLCTVYMYSSIQYLIGAPLAWAGLSRTVMVVAVSFRKASDPSYSSIVGAVERVFISAHV